MSESILLLRFAFCTDRNQFIGALGGKVEQSSSGIGLGPDTKSVTPYICTIPHNSRIHLQGRLVLLDTPGLDEVVKLDAMMLREILDGIEAKYVVF